MKPDFNFDINYDFFSDSEVDLSENFETRYINPPKTKLFSDDLLRYENAEKLAKDIKIEQDSRIYAFVNGSFIFGDFIEALIVENDYEVNKMIISSLSLSIENVDSLANLVNGGYVKNLNIIISDYFYSHERNKTVKYIYSELDKNKSKDILPGYQFQLAVASSHCKLCTIETACGKKIVIHGSANMRSSSNIEQIMIEESKILYDFNNTIQDQIIEMYKTINKSVRRKKLWEAVKE